jgi:hypothetical protein
MPPFDPVEETAKAVAYEWLTRGGRVGLSVAAFERLWNANRPEWDDLRATCRAFAADDPMRHMNCEVN